MIFFFRKKKVVIDAFTHMRTAYEYFPIDYAIKFVPEWWKSLPKEYTKTTNLGLNLDISTLKRCNGFLDLYARGFVLPMWSDLVMNTQETGGYQFQWANSNSADITTHSAQQYGMSVDEKFIHLKILSPWMVQEKTGVKFIWTSPTWSRLFDDNLTILPGVVDYKYQHGTNINLFIEKKNSTYKLMAGEAMSHVVPLSDHKIEIKTHLIGKDEFFKKDEVFAFANKYKRVKQITDGKEKKCPFGFK